MNGCYRTARSRPLSRVERLSVYCTLHNSPSTCQETARQRRRRHDHRAELRCFPARRRSLHRKVVHSSRVRDDALACDRYAEWFFSSFGFVGRSVHSRNARLHLISYVRNKLRRPTERGIRALRCTHKCWWSPV